MLTASCLFPQELANAYEVLSDPEARAAYDEGGQERLRGGGGGGGRGGGGRGGGRGQGFGGFHAGFRFQSADDIFKEFFGNEAEGFSATFNTPGGAPLGRAIRRVGLAAHSPVAVEPPPLSLSHARRAVGIRKRLPATERFC